MHVESLRSRGYMPPSNHRHFRFGRRENPKDFPPLSEGVEDGSVELALLCAIDIEETTTPPGPHAPHNKEGRARGG